MGLNRDFKLAAGQSWTGVGTFRDRLLIKLDGANADSKISPGTYSFAFPAMVPCCTEEDMPKNNVWYLSLCTDQECADLDDESVVVSFPIAGFSLNDPPTASETISATGTGSTASRQLQVRKWAAFLGPFAAYMSILR